MFSNSFILFLIFIFFYIIIKTKLFFTTFLLFVLLSFVLKDLFYKKKKNYNQKIIKTNFIKEKKEVKEIIEEIENIFKKENENNIEIQIKEEEKEIPKIKKMSLNIIQHFSLPKENYNKIYYSLKNILSTYEIQNYCDCLFYLFIFCNNINEIKQLEIATYIIWNSNNQDQIDSVYEKIIEMSSNRNYNDKIRANAIDILIRSNNKKYLDRSNVLLEKLRQDERINNDNNDIHQIRKNINKLRQIVHQQPVTLNDEDDIELQHVLFEQIRNLENRANNIIENQKRKATVYNDSQNVHNHEINNSIINIASNLVSSETPPSNMLNIDDELKRWYPEYENHKTQIDASLNRINTDSSKFKDNMTIKMVFDKVVGIISKSPHNNELIRRLGEELYEMNGLCTTGHMSRIVNVLQGFDDLPEELKIKINPKDEIYATISAFLTSEIQKSKDSEQLMDDMIDSNMENHMRYLNFVSENMKTKVKELEKEYRGIIEADELKVYIHDSLLNYLNSDKDVKIILQNIN